jgi:hypothetical protein
MAAKIAQHTRYEPAHLAVDATITRVRQAILYVQLEPFSFGGLRGEV